jgi:hypothetical protein
MQLLRSRRRLTSIVIALVALTALAAVSASPAAAAKVAAKFSAPTLKLSSGASFTLKKGAETTSCTLNKGFTAGNVSESFVYLQNGGSLGDTEYTCTGGKVFGIFLQMIAYRDTVTGAFTLDDIQSTGTNRSPWGTYGPVLWNGSWVNGTGGGNSTFTLNEVVIGKLSSSGESIKLSGSFTATTSTGGVITLS